MESALATRI